MLILLVEMVKWQRQVGCSVILHSDCGSHFRSSDYQRFLKQNTLLCSMSAVGYCGDNTACEGVFGMLKWECTNRWNYLTMDTGKADTFREPLIKFNHSFNRHTGASDPQDVGNVAQRMDARERPVVKSDLQISDFLKPSVEMG